MIWNTALLRSLVYVLLRRSSLPQPKDTEQETILATSHRPCGSSVCARRFSPCKD